MSVPLARQGILEIRAHMVGQPESGVPPVTTALNSNESALGASPMAVMAARAAVTGIERYFENPGPMLAAALAERFGLDERRIAVGQGSDDLLARLARVYLHPGSELVRSANGYLKTPNYAHANDAKPVAVPDVEFRACVDGILESVTDKTKIVYLANPENPAGSYLSGQEIRRLHAGLPDHVLLVIDSAYEEYVDAPDYEPGHHLVEAAENVVMVRTFSKIFGLAGARVGWMYGTQSMVDLVNRIGLTFPISSAAIAAAVAALGDRDHTNRVREANRRNRVGLASTLSGFGLKCYASQANFLLVGFPDPALSAEAASEFLRRRGIAVRRFASPAYDDCIRITLGLDRELDIVKREIANFLNGDSNA